LLNEAAPMTTVHPSIYHDELLMLDEYTEKVTATFGRQFEADRARLAGGNRLLSRFADAMSAVKTHGRTKAQQMKRTMSCASHPHCFPAGKLSSTALPTSRR
jgi:hypothetical protein